MKLPSSAALGLCASLAGIALPFLATPASQAAVALQPDHPQTYRVRAGDTLWGIAGRFLREPWRWPEVWEGNPEVSDPNLIFPGEVLKLELRPDGSPRIRSARGRMRVVKLSPRIRVTELEVAIPTIPISTIAPFLSRAVVADSEEINSAPYVVGFPDGQLLAGAGDTVFVRSIMNAPSSGYEILRPGQEYRDPRTGEVLGFEAAFVAEARLERTGDPATLVITRSNVEVEIGDRARPARDESVLRSFLPRPAPLGLEGQIIAVLGGVSQIGQYDVVVINRGARDQVEPGQVFEVYQGGDERRDQMRRNRADWNWRNETPLDTSFWFGAWEITGWRRDKPDPNAPLPLHREAQLLSDTYIAPASQAGLIMVFRVFPRVSWALVMKARKAMHVGEIVSTPREG